jgi:short-subunit dehydrogenase
MESTAKGSFAVVTGASSGIGLELAKQFAQHGFDLLIVADSSKIREATSTLKSYNVSVSEAQIDLAKPAGVAELYRVIRDAGRPVDAIALNAGVGAGGDFVRETALDADFNVIDLNIKSTVHLAKLVLKDMVQRGQGRVLFTSSIAATMPGTFNAVYNASKAFIQSFAQAVRSELKGTGVTITALMPGATETNFFHRAGMDDTKVARSEKDDPADVAKTGFEALMAGDDHVVAGSFMNKVQATMAHVLPDTVTADMHRKQAKPANEKR